MAKGISVHVGVNDTQAPGISVGQLKGCQNDARSMLALARAQGFTGDAEPMIDNQATFENVLGAIRVAAEELEDGDIFLFTFSGHGTRRGAEDPIEKDLKDETLVLFDRLLVDNVLRRNIWPTFKAGVRVVMVSDSCHGGGAAMSRVDFEDESEAPSVAIAGGSAAMSRVDFEDESEAPSVAIAGGGRAWSAAAARQTRTGLETVFGVREISDVEADAHFDLLKDFYKELRESLPAGDPPAIPAKVLLLAACQEHQKTRDGLPHGVFTQALLDVWNTAGTKTYKQLIDGITDKLEATGPTPVMLDVGDSPAFSETKAFTI